MDYESPNSLLELGTTCGDFVLPDGSIFDPDIGLGPADELPQELSFGELLSETRSVLKRYGYKPTMVDSFHQLSSEVGDDEVDVSTHPVGAAMLTVIYQMLGMKVSWEDTSINPRFGNFAEDLVILPDGYEQTYHFARQSSDMKNMAFLDVPKLRLAIDIRPGRMNHSSTNDGKAGILGSRLAWLPRDSPIRVLYEVFNLYQDINLGLIRDEKFAYLPTALGGYGKPVPFGVEENFDRFSMSYRQGTHAPLARELVRRTNNLFEQYKVQGILEEDYVLSAVARLQSGYHDWIKTGTVYTPTCWVDAPPEVMPFRVGKHGLDVTVDAAMRVLNAEGYLVTENDLEIAYEHNQLCKFLLESETHDEFIARRKAERDKWNGLSIYSLRLYGIIAPYRLDQTLQGPFLSNEYGKFWLNITSRRIHLRSFLRQENFYEAAAKDLIYQNGPMKVHMAIQPKVTQMGRRYWYEETRDTTDILRNEGDYGTLLNWIKDPERGGIPPIRSIIEDDPVIISIAKMKPPTAGLAIVSDDIRLCRDVYNQTKIWVCRVPVKWYYMSVYYGEGDEPWIAALNRRFPFLEWETILDEGSVETYGEIGFRDGLPIDRPCERKFRLTRNAFHGHKRRFEPRETAGTVLADWKPYNFPEDYIFSPGHFLTRKKHPYRRGFA
jgi:hypothetical protein